MKRLNGPHIEGVVLYTGPLMIVVALAAQLCSSSLASPAVARALEPRPVDVESYTESFMMMADMEDGSYLQLHLAISNVGMGSRKGACRAVWVRPGQKTWAAGEEVGEAWRFDRKPVPTLEMKRCRLRAGEQTEVEMAVGGRDVTLRLAAQVTVTRPPGHVIQTEDGFYRNRILVPWASARLEEKGRPSLEGHGYLDHFRSTSLPGDLAQRYVRFRALGPPCRALLLVRVPPKGGAVGWVWAEGQSQPVELNQLSISMKKDAVTLQTDRGTHRLTIGKQLHRHAPVEEHGVLGSLVGSWVGNPVTRTFRSRLTGLSNCAEARGLLELTEIK